MTRLDLLEFYGPTGPAAAEPSPAWQEGHAAGLAEGHARALADCQSLSETVVTRIEDMRFTHAEAQAQVLSALRPLFETLIDRVLPVLQETSTTLHLQRLLSDAAARDAEAPLLLRLSPAEADAFGPGLVCRPGPPVRIEADPALVDGEAVLGSAPSLETALDVPTLLETARSALSALVDDMEERTDHG